MRYSIARKLQKHILSSQSFGGCTRDFKKKDWKLGEVVGEVELLAHSPHDLFEQPFVIYSQLLAHPICPIGTSDGESNNTSRARLLLLPQTFLTGTDPQ